MTVDLKPENSPKKIFAASRLATWIALLIIFAAGVGIRLYDLTDAPLDFHGTRQMHSAMIARGMYYQTLPDAPQWQKQMALEQWKKEGLIEPQIMETLAAQTYRLTGTDALWIPRLYAILFWVLGGVGLFLLARNLTDENGGVVALLFYLGTQYGIIASRSFQPDPLLVAMSVWAFWGMERWFRKQTWKWVIVAGLLAGLSIYVKSTAVFWIAGAWAGLILGGVGLRKALRNPQVWVLAVLSVLPYAAYHVYASNILHLLESQFSLRFFPQMWIEPGFYLRLKGTINRVVSFEWLLAAVAGFALMRDRVMRGMFFGVGIGYAVYSILFSYYTSSHDYYHLPLIPLVGIGLALAFTMLLAYLSQPRWLLSAIMVILPMAWFVFQLWDARVDLKADDYRNEVTFWTEVGTQFKPDDDVVSITSYYGYPLAYWGWVNNANWLSTGDFALRELAGMTFDMQKFFEEETAGRDYFLVTNFGELERQPEIQKILTEHYPLVKKTSGYAIYDLRSPLPAAPAP